jgi:8-oxo-dGTP pyrophosphatase MutT (NUDIX family)
VVERTYVLDIARRATVALTHIRNQVVPALRGRRRPSRGGLWHAGSTVHSMTRRQGTSDQWVVHAERVIYKNEWVTVGLADISQPSGNRFEHHTVTLPAAAMTVVLDDQATHVLLSWRHRFVPDVWNWELPGGLIDAGETAAETAAREVEEETGYRPRSVEHLVTFEPMVGTVRSPHHVFLSRGAVRVGDATEVDEGKFEWVPLASVPALIAQGEIVNSGSLVGLLHVLASGEAPASSCAE